MDRRTFLAALAAAATSSIASAAAERQRLGVQLYTLRNELQQDFEGSLRKVAAIGTRKWSLPAYFGRSPAEVRRVLDATGLSAPSAHIDYKLLGAEFSENAGRRAGHGASLSGRGMDGSGRLGRPGYLEARRRRLQPGRRGVQAGG